MLLTELGELLPADVLARLLDTLGGTRLYLPYDPATADGRAAVARDVLGPHWPAFHANWCGTHVTLPTAADARRSNRDACIREARAAGASVDDLALAYRLTRRRVQQIVAAGRASDRAA